MTVVVMVVALVVGSGEWRMGSGKLLLGVAGVAGVASVGPGVCVLRYDAATGLPGRDTVQLLHKQRCAEVDTDYWAVWYTRLCSTEQQEMLRFCCRTFEVVAAALREPRVPLPWSRVVASER
ncbi:hypothetical protein M430DRAFT_17698 [Amorphotheca resinae ATCC 22711]|uniref:Uncharacterized protein n=1 Tax=Amorphotheca resinae ATCC 22711 TaxID=857342 RepID=A0A2T3B5W7_AMORE|nr:hypothetical protein M430DRAFT_17698 [Amorphotheca resinae ATCC 22711]PSS22138.1 hypothetical protein M430DRAFT_17698 [Amorphotheca resinae ATCC 22711]